MGWTQSFAYDGLNRLTSASRSDGGYNHTYNYDSFGNLLIQDNLNPGPTYDISPATNQLNRWNGIVNMYTYDAAGNLTSSGTSDIGGHTYSYNAQNQITAVDGGATAMYLYNSLDQRAYKVTSAGWTNYIYFNGQPIEEFVHDAASGNNSWNDYIYANGQKIAKITYGGDLKYYLDDHLGTTQVELNADGTVNWQGQFTPFGAELPDGSTAMHYKFTGKERDTESGLDYFGARYYASSMGRWMSPDWAEKPEAVPYSQLANPQSLNLYGYVVNNPLSKPDLDGHGAWDSFVSDIKKAGHDAVEAVKSASVTVEVGVGLKWKGIAGTNELHAGGTVHGELKYSRKGEQATFKAEVDAGAKGPLGVVAGGERGYRTTSDSNELVNGVESYHENESGVAAGGDKELTSNGEELSLGEADYPGAGGGFKVSVGANEGKKLAGCPTHDMLLVMGGSWG